MRWSLGLTVALAGSFLFIQPNSTSIARADSPSNDKADKAPASSARTPEKGLRLAYTEGRVPQSTDDERRFVELVNKERAKRGLSQLVIDPLLIEVAREHSQEMRDRKYFNHVSPTASLKTPMDRYLKAVSSRPAYACVGENLFYCSVTDVERGHTAFMNSPTHRENVLFARYEKIGVGIVSNEAGEFWVTEMFLSTTDPVVVARKMSSNR